MGASILPYVSPLMPSELPTAGEADQSAMPDSLIQGASRGSSGSCKKTEMTVSSCNHGYDHSLVVMAHGIAEYTGFEAWPITVWSMGHGLCRSFGHATCSTATCPTKFFLTKSCVNEKAEASV